VWCWLRRWIGGEKICTRAAMIVAPLLCDYVGREFGDGYILVVGSSIPFTTVPTPLLIPLQTVNNSLSNIACFFNIIQLLENIK
jgi:hypothetical protein